MTNLLTLIIDSCGIPLVRFRRCLIIGCWVQHVNQSLGTGSSVGAEANCEVYRQLTFKTPVLNQQICKVTIIS